MTLNLWEKSGKRGKVWPFRESTTFIGKPANDEISSLEITDDEAAPEAWIVFEHKDYGGKAWGPFISPGVYDTKQGWYPNDEISSLKKFTKVLGLNAKGFEKETMIQLKNRAIYWVEKQGTDVVTPSEVSSGAEPPQVSDDDKDDDSILPDLPGLPGLPDLPIPDLKLPAFPDIKLFDIFDPAKRKEFWDGVLDYFWQSPDDIHDLMDAFNLPVLGIIGFNPFIAKFGVPMPFSMAFLFRNKMKLAADEGVENVKALIIPFVLSIIVTAALIALSIWFIIKYKPVRRILKWAWTRGKKVGSKDPQKTVKKIAKEQRG